MPWTEKNMKTGELREIPGQEAQGRSMDASAWAGTLSKESREDKSITPIEFQPVQSPGNYEAEFAVKGDDVIFHFWPWGYHDADNRGTALPRFKKDFVDKLNASMAGTFGQHRLQISEDPDMGAFFVKAVGFGSNQFHRQLCIEACENLHKRSES